ncbi:MAG: phospholipase D-like domain-containing protein [Planctomycetes bacterium]|nr:phospholipase D-like domain-containing protein [Planctomycetota bacterium]
MLLALTCVLFQAVPADRAAPATPSRAGAPLDAPALEIVETAPLETTLDHPDLRDADVVWKELFDGAQRSIELAQFYVCDKPPSKLTPVLAALEAAAARGVEIRFLADAKFWEKYPETLTALDAREHVDVRKLDFGDVAGGVLHAKYFVIDRERVYLGSQNFDWRSLEHIQELGVSIASRDIAGVFGAVFDSDWRAAGRQLGLTVLEPEPRIAKETLAAFPLELTTRGGSVRVSPLVSPKDHTLAPELFDLPKIVELIDRAERTVRIELLTYKPAVRGGPNWDALDGALRRAAERGVDVQLLVADWSKRKGTIEALQSLEPLERLAVKLVTIPQASTGYVPFARVIHAKYCVVDGARAWLGTSNWERDYFYESRNVGVLVEGAPFATQLERCFADVWTSPYAAAVDPQATYEVPRFGE